MGKHTFFYKDGNSDDRDCVKYIDLSRLGKLECGHYFPSVSIGGSCFSSSLRLNEIDFDNIISVLSKNDFLKIDAYNKAIDELGYGIAKGDEKYQKGIELYNGVKKILDKLLSEENELLFEQVKEIEIEYLQDEHNLDEVEVLEIFNNYGLDYRDRAVVGAIYEDVEECAREYAESTGMFNEHNKTLEEYFDFKRFGEDLTDSEQYYVLSDGRVVYLSY